jgi:hypothetical protein
VDNLDITAYVAASVVPRGEHYHAVLDEYIAVPARNGVDVSDAHKLWASCWLSACYVH